MASSGLVAGTWGNVSCRIAGRPWMAVTPSGMDYPQLKVTDIVLMDFDGQTVEGDRRPSTESTLHAAIYRARPEVGAVVHTHSQYATAFAVARQPIPAVTEELAQVVGGAVQVARYETCGTSELADAAVEALGSSDAVLLANHGVVGTGKNLEEAYRNCIIVEKTAQIAVLARSLGGYTELDAQQVEEMRRIFLTKYGQI